MAALGLGTRLVAACVIRSTAPVLPSVPCKAPRRLAYSARIDSPSDNENCLIRRKKPWLEILLEDKNAAVNRPELHVLV